MSFILLLGLTVTMWLAGVSPASAASAEMIASGHLGLRGGLWSIPRECGVTFEDALGDDAWVLDSCPRVHATVHHDHDRYIAKLSWRTVEGVPGVSVVGNSQDCRVATQKLADATILWCDSVKSSTQGTPAQQDSGGPEAVAQPEDPPDVVEVSATLVMVEQRVSPTPAEAKTATTSVIEDPSNELVFHLTAVGTGSLGDGHRALGRGIGLGAGFESSAYRVEALVVHEQLTQVGLPPEVPRPGFSHGAVRGCLRLDMRERLWQGRDISVPLCGGLAVGLIQNPGVLDASARQTRDRAMWSGLQGALVFIFRGMGPVGLRLGAEGIMTLTGPSVETVHDGEVFSFFSRYEVAMRLTAGVELSCNLGERTTCAEHRRSRRTARRRARKRARSSGEEGANNGIR